MKLDDDQLLDGWKYVRDDTSDMGFRNEFHVYENASRTYELWWCKLDQIGMKRHRLYRTLNHPDISGLKKREMIHSDGFLGKDGAISTAKRLMRDADRINEMHK